MSFNGMKIDPDNKHLEKKSKQPRLLIFGVSWDMDSPFVKRKLNGLLNYGFQVKLAVRKPKGKFASPGQKKIPIVRILNIFRPDDLFYFLLLFIRSLLLNPKRLFKFLGIIKKSSGSIRSKIVQVIISLPLITETPGLIHYEWISQAVDFEWVYEFFCCPVVVSNRGRQLNIFPYIPDYEQNVADLLRVIAKSDAVHCVCEDIKQQAVNLGMPHEKGVVVYTAVDPEIFKPIQQRTSNEQLKIIMVGSLIWRKGYDFAFLAFQKILNEGINARLVIIGSGDDHDHLVFTAKDLSISENVEFAGHLEIEEVLQVLQSGDIFLHTAVSEGIPNSLIEAMACGLPVIAADCGGIREALDHEVEGLIVPTRDAIATADAILRLGRSENARRKMGSAGRERVLRQFDLEKQAEEFSLLYRSLIMCHKNKIP
jgi:colanic acid/amylovoran biosynthesis glycosyltransferase